MSPRKTILLALLWSSALTGGVALGNASAGLAAPYKPLAPLKVTGARGVAVEAATGDVFVVDGTDKKVVKLDPEGTVLGEITGIETPEGQLKNALGVAVDNSGGSSADDVYVAAGGEVVDKFKPKSPGSNEYTYVCEPIGEGAGCPGGGIPEELTVRGLAVSANGDLYADNWSSITPVVFELSPEGEVLPSSPLQNTHGEHNLTLPFGVAIDSKGDTYIVNEKENVVKFNASGEIQHEPELEANEGAIAVTINQTSGEVFVVDSNPTYHVTRYNPEGKKLEEFGAGEITESVGIAYNPKNGDIYVTDEATGEVHIYAEEKVETEGPYKPLAPLKVTGARGVAVEAATGDVFVVDGTDKKVVKLDSEGTVLGEITGIETPEGQLKNALGVAVDNSGGSSADDVYVAAGGEVVDKFKPKSPGSNEYTYVCEPIGEGAGCPGGGIPEELTVRGLAVSANGDLYAGNWSSITPVVFELSPEGEVLPSSPLQNTHGEHNLTLPFGVAIDSKGDTYIVNEKENVVKFNASGEIQHEPELEANEGAIAVTINQTSGEVFVVDSNPTYHVTRYNPEGKKLEEFGAGEITESVGIAYNPKNGDIYVTDEATGEVHIYARGVGKPPNVKCEMPAVVGTTSAKVLCTVVTNEEASWEFEYAELIKGILGEYKKVPGASGHILGGGSTEVPVEGEIKGLEPGGEYRYRLVASNKSGLTRSKNGVEAFTTNPAVAGTTKCTASTITGETAVLKASLEPAGSKVEYWFEYGRGESYGSKTKIEESEGGGAVVAKAPVTSLEPNRAYDCRLVARREIEDKTFTTYGENGSLKTLALKPTLIGQSSSNVGTHSAQLNATIDPENSTTTYLIQYVATAHYHPESADPYSEGSTAPGEPALAGSDDAFHTVQQVLGGLIPSTTYHYRAVMTNSPGEPGTGTTVGEDQTFTTTDTNAPAVSTGPVSGVTQTGATLSGSVNPEGYATSYVFEIGTTANGDGAAEYATGISGVVEGAGTLPQDVTLALANLVPLTTYRYRLSATNANGTSYSQPVEFTTPGLAYSLTLPLVPPLLSTPAIAFPTETTIVTTTTPKKLSNAQKLAKALKACKAKKNHRKRASCVRSARKKYGPKSA